MTGPAAATAGTVRAERAPAVPVPAAPGSPHELVDGCRPVWEPARMVHEASSSPAVVAADGIDGESREWLDRLTSTGPSRAVAIEALFELLRRAAVREAQRRRGSLPAHVVQELDDLARQAAGDAVEAVLRKLPDYRGASRFTTWAYKFVVFEVSTALRREAWRGRSINIEEASWERLVDRTPVDPAAESEGRELIMAIQRAIRTHLTVRQREILVAVTILDVPIDALAERQASTRGAVYKVLHDARRKLQQALEADGWPVDEIGRRT